MKKRILASLLSFCLLVGLLPVVTVQARAGSEDDEIGTEETAGAAEQDDTGSEGGNDETDTEEAPEGEEDDGVSNTDEEGHLTRVGLAVMLCANHTLNAAMQEKVNAGQTVTFSDLGACSEEQRDAITLLVQAGVMDGEASDGEGDASAFNPSDAATRGMAALAIYRALGSESDTAAETQTIFTDIEEPYTSAVNYLVAEGILTKSDIRSDDDAETGLFKADDAVRPQVVEGWLDRLEKDDGGEEVPNVVEVEGVHYYTRAGLAQTLYTTPSMKAAMEKIVDETKEVDFSDIENCDNNQLAAITLAAQAGVMNGGVPDSDGVSAFHPGETATRAAAAIALWRILGSKTVDDTQDITIPYSDISDQWYASAIRSLVADGILTAADVVEGEDGTENCFGPDEGINPDVFNTWMDRVEALWENAGGEDEVPEGALTRAQLAETIYANEALRKLINLAAWGEAEELAFSDIEGCTEAQKTAIYAMARARVLSGNIDGTFAPNGTATRAQAAVVLWRAMGCLSNKEAVELPYADVNAQQWYAAAINCLYALGVLTDADALEDEGFRVDAPIEAEELEAWLTAYDAITEAEISAKTVGNGLSRAEMVVLFYNEYKAMLPDASGYADIATENFTDISGCTEEQKAVIGLFSSLALPSGGAIVNGLGPPYLGNFAPFAAASNAQTVAILSRLITWIEAQEETAEEAEAAAFSLEDEGTLWSTMTMALVSNANADDWYADALAFLAERGLGEDAVTTVNENPDAPAVEEDLQSWSKALKPDAPVFSPAAGTYSSTQSVTLTAEEGAVIHYTTDGSEPTADSAVYSSAITVSSSMTIKAIAIRNSLPSDTVSAAYTISSGSFSSGGSGSSSTTTTTTKNDDGSTTTTVTNKTTGTVTETTKYTDGSTLVVETEKDGTVTTTETTVENVVVKTVDEPGEDVTATVTIPRSVGTATVTIPADTTPGTVAVDATTGEIVKLSVPTEDGLTVKLDGSASLILVDNSKDFTDTSGHWAEDAIDFVTAHEMFQGTSTSAATFSPENTMTRAMLMTVLTRFDGYDTEGGAVWYEKGMEWAVSKGVSDGSNPNGSITREQFAVMLYRYAGSPAVSSSIDHFTDADKVSGYAADAMRWAVSTGIIGGMGDGTLAPQGSATRAQVATMLMRYVEHLTK